MIRSLLVLMIGLHSIIFNAQDSTSYKLLPVEIRAQKSFTAEKISLNRSHFLSAPATFDDPSRLLIKYPGFSVSNDQNNAIIYDGLPSHYSTWSLYGAQIANPNHLSNAGTANDRPSRSAGGVNMFSGQVIGGLDYHTGSDGPAHGIGGVADMSIRTPFENNVTANLSLIGLEAGLDKVFDDGKASLLANYRYSTVGLLDKLGVELGDEIINYQDAITEYRKKLKNIELRITAIYGSSSNNHEASAIQGEPNIEFKNIQDIEYTASNRTLAMHVKSDNFLLTFAYSNRKNNRSSAFIFDNDFESIISTSNENIYSIYAHREWLKDNRKLVLSINANRYSQRVVDQNSKNYIFDLNVFNREIFFKDNYFELRPKILMDWNFTNSQKLSFGSSSFSSTFSDEFFLLPFIVYQTKFKSINTIFSFQNDRQAIAPEILGMRGYFGNQYFENADLKSINSWNFKLDLNREGHGIVLFTNYIYDTPLSRGENPFGNFENYGLDNLGNLPIAEYTTTNDVATYGIKAYTRFDLGGYSLNANYTWMDSQMDSEPERKVPLDFGNLLNLGVDRSYHFSDSKSLRMTIAYHFRNGFQRLSIDDDQSKNSLQTIYSGLGLGRLADYHRMDLRISYIKKGNWKNVISLDIQNVLNRQNEAFYYYDPVLNENVLQRQLGLIPILSWRVII